MSTESNELRTASMMSGWRWPKLKTPPLQWQFRSRRPEYASSNQTPARRPSVKFIPKAS